MSLTRAAMIRRAFGLAGVKGPSDAYQDGEYEMAVDLLTTDLDALQDQGAVLKTISSYSVNINAGETTASTPANLLNVYIGPDNVAGVVYDTAATDPVQSQVMALDRHSYVTGILDKDATATLPTHVYVNTVSSSPTLTFWPVPTALCLFTYQGIFLDETMEVFRRWQKAVMWTLAGSIARSSSRPLADVEALEKRAEKEIMLAKGSDRELVNGQFYVPRYGGGCV